MFKKFLLLGLLLFSIGCGQGWTMDYGDPAAQFLSSVDAEKVQQYAGKKVSIKGFVASVDTTDPQNVWVDLDHGIRCNFGNFKEMAIQHAVGDEVIIDGVLRIGDDVGLILDPALSRDMTAPFWPQ